MEFKDYYRQKRKKKLVYRFYFAFGIFFLVIAAIWGFFWLPIFGIKNIAVENYYDAGAIKSSVAEYLASKNSIFLPKNNFFLLKTDDIKRILEKDGFGVPEVNKKFPSSLFINFTETFPWLIFCPKDSCFYVDSEGVISGRAPNFSENPLPELSASSSLDLNIGDQIIGRTEAQFTGILFDGLKSAGAAPVKIEIQKGGAIKIFLKEGWYLLASFGLNPKQVAYDLKLLLDQKIAGDRPRLEYIDMRFPNKAFYKLKSVN